MKTKQAVIIGLIACASSAGCRFETGIYSPLLGDVVTGESKSCTHDPERFRAEVTAETRMSQNGQSAPTLKDMADFFGIESCTLLCTINDNAGLSSKGVIPVNRRISMCLNRPPNCNEEEPLQ